MKFSVAQVENMISESPRKNGCFNLFFKLNDEIGLKLSVTEETRNKNYEAQTECAKHGLGPETYGTIDEVELLGSNCNAFPLLILSCFLFP